MKLINGECLEEMKNIPDGSIDMILCDLPYGISKKSGFCKGNKNNLDYDKKYGKYNIYFGDWDKKDINLILLANEYYRLLKKGGVCVIFYDIWGSESIKEAFKKFKQPRILQWIKSNPVPINSKINFLSNSSEYIFSFIKDKKPIYNSSYNNGVFIFPICHGKERTIHPTQKPLSLINELIKIYSNEGCIILDNCMGSGTTGVSCKNLNRDFIGIELDKTYFEIAKNRILLD